MTLETVHVAHHLYLRRLEILAPFVNLPTPDEWGGDFAQIHADNSR